MTQLPAQPQTTQLCTVEGGEQTPLLICGPWVQETETAPDLRNGEGFHTWGDVLPKLQEGVRLLTEPPKMTLRTEPKRSSMGNAFEQLSSRHIH